jgi:hypothetical protein
MIHETLGSVPEAMSATKSFGKVWVNALLNRAARAVAERGEVGQDVVGSAITSGLIAGL